MHKTAFPSRRAAAAALFLFAPFALPAQVQPAGPQPLPSVLQAPPAVCAAFEVHAATLQDLLLPQVGVEQLLLQVWLGNQLQTLQLHRHDVRAPDFQLQVDDGTGIHTVPTPLCTTFQGDLLAVPGSAAAVSIVGGRLRGIVLDGQQQWGIQPLADVDPNAAAARHIVFRDADLTNLPFHCGVVGTQAGPNTPVNDTDALSQAQIACEVDYPHYQRFNNVTAAQNDVTGVINAVDVIYRRDVNITYQVTTILVRTAGDPYSTTSSSTLLSQFTTWWNAYQGAVARDVAHLFTGRPLNGNVIGIAFLGVVCNLGSAYGLVETMYAGSGTNFSRRVGLSAHEIGHNWNAGHCDASTDCRIMCSGLGGCSGNVSSFSPGAQNQIIAFRNTRSCLTTAYSAPVLVTMAPNSVPAFRPPQVNVTGLNLLGSNQVQVGSQTGAFSVFASSDTQARFVPPPPTVLGPQPVRFVNPGGTSNPLTLTYTATSPCGLSAPGVAIGGNPAVFAFGGQPNHGWFLVVSVLPATAPLQGQQVLSSLSLLGIGTLDAVGLGSFAVPVPAGILNGLTLYEQVLEVDLGSLSLVSASAVASTRILL